MYHKWFWFILRSRRNKKSWTDSNLCGLSEVKALFVVDKWSRFRKAGHVTISSIVIRRFSAQTSTKWIRKVQCHKFIISVFLWRNKTIYLSWLQNRFWKTNNGTLYQGSCKNGIRKALHGVCSLHIPVVTWPVFMARLITRLYPLPHPHAWFIPVRSNHVFYASCRC